MAEEQPKKYYPNRANVISSQQLKKHNIQRKECADGRTLFFLSTDHPAFERVVGREPQEVFPDWHGEIPLGDTAAEAVIALYGLSNTALYHTDAFIDCITKIPEAPEKMMSLLRAAAYAKYDGRHHRRLADDTLTAIEKALAILDISPADIVEDFRYLRG
ncbi:MAG: hypothetical protein IJU37_09360 [Desulfovibrio sp.]|nr:hypothetical protein [Desulfovibrio sp.]